VSLTELPPPGLHKDKWDGVCMVIRTPSKPSSQVLNGRISTENAEALTLSDRRFMGMQVVNEDQYTPATCYGAGTHTLTREMVVIVVSLSIFRTRKTSGKSMLCRMRSGSARKRPARLKFLIGMRQASRRGDHAHRQLRFSESDKSRGC
jgi:hypothetical protein